jgi:hypothetical protein
MSPVDVIPGYVREAVPADADWSSLAAEVLTGRAPDSRLVVVDEFARDSGWRPPERGRSYACRWTTGPGHRTCRRPAVATLLRGYAHRSGRPQRWGYCEDHCYGRRWQAGRLLAVIRG